MHEEIAKLAAVYAAKIEKINAKASADREAMFAKLDAIGSQFAVIEETRNAATMALSVEWQKLDGELTAKMAAPVEEPKVSKSSKKSA